MRSGTQCLCFRGENVRGGQLVHVSNEIFVHENYSLYGIVARASLECNPHVVCTCTCMFYDFTGISLLCASIGGRDIRDLDPSWFRKHIGLVSQEPVLFACSISDNICYGRSNATQEEVQS